jgi:hypothetical protein
MRLNETYNKVRSCKHLSDNFSIQNGPKQGDAISTITTLKRSDKLHNGRLPILHDQKIHSVQMKGQNIVVNFF